MRLVGVCVAALAAAGAIGACTSDGSSSLSSGTEGAGATGSGGGLGQGGFSQTGGNGQGGFDECFGDEKSAKPALEAADIIFAIDTSGSMGEESGFVNEKMNAFSQQIIDSGVDVRVVMLAEPPIAFPFPLPITPPGICIDAPLGSGNCPDDANPPLYYHPSSEIGSSDSLQVIYDLFPSYGDVLREDANTYLIIITDDNYAPNTSLSDPILDAQDFITRWTALAPTKLTGFMAHAIYCFSGSGDCVQKGQVYEDLVNATAGGIHGDLAQQDFQPIFDAVADQVIINAGALPCEYVIPAPPDGEALDPNQVNVVFTDGANVEHEIYKVDGAGDCDPVDGGWYYDNPANPTKIILCPATCDVVSNDPDATMDIVFGCATKLPPPE